MMTSGRAQGMDRHKFGAWLANAIDTSWHYSWHWDREDGGALTTQGLAEALSDCRKEKAECLERAARLTAVEKSILEELDAMDFWVANR